MGPGVEQDGEGGSEVAEVADGVVTWAAIVEEV